MGATLVVEQEVTAEPSAVYGARTSAGAFARWWWPHIGEADDLRQGWHDVLARLAGTAGE